MKTGTRGKTKTRSRHHESSAAGISRKWKIIFSIAICIQLLAVVAEPFRFFTRSPRGTSPAADPVRLSLAPYVEFAYLNHGYFFFAPEPGPSHLMECKLQFADGESGTLRFPDLDAQWPRLLYHRHFMLSEFLQQLHVPPVDPELAKNANSPEDKQLLAQWRAERRRYEQVRDSFVKHVTTRYNATKASISRIEHRLPSSAEVLVEGWPLDDKRLYIELPDGPELPAAASQEPSRIPFSPLVPRGFGVPNTNGQPAPPPNDTSEPIKP